MKKCYLAFAAVLAVSSLVLFVSCDKLSTNANYDLCCEEISPELLASEHSAALKYLFERASEDGMTLSQVETKSEPQKILTENYIVSVLNEYNSDILKNAHIPQTKANNIDEELLNSAYSIAITYIQSQENVFSSCESLKTAVENYLQSVNDCYPEEVNFALSTSLYILVDSYSYWIDSDGFALWITTFLSEEDQRSLAEQNNIPFPGVQTKVSGTEMRAWSEMARADIANGGIAQTVIDDDASAFISGGVLSKFANIQAVLIGSGVASAISFLKNYFT